MQLRVKLLSFLLLAFGVGLMTWLVVNRAPHADGPLRHQAYVWQRAWTPPVREAVSQRASHFAELCVLKAEVSWKENHPQVTRVGVDYATLTNVACPIGIALRIGAFAGPFEPGIQGASGSAPTESNSLPDGTPVLLGKSPVTDYLCDLGAGLVAEARSNHLALSELQIDFDCAESKLDGYRIWVEAIQQRVAPLPVSITALPSWLDSRAFKRLARVATNYVLQVHSVERPKSPDAPFTLCDPRAASRAVERAGLIGVPFRVALPTYGYLLAFDANGKFLGLSAEGPRPNWPADAKLREVQSDPKELALLVRDWTHRRPAAMTGVIWYRLPVATDTFNWRWPTLGAIVAGVVPREKFRADARRVEAGLVEIDLVNEGELDISSRLAVEVRWSDARLVAGDGLRDFELAEQAVSAARFQTLSAARRLPAGERLLVGWLRFDRDCEVRCEVKKF